MGQERQQQQSRYNSRNERDPIQSTSSSKSTISSLLSTFTPKTSANDKNKCYYTSSRFRGLGCTAPAQVSVPSMIRTSANWEEGKKLRKKKTKKNSNTNDGDGVSLVISTNTPPLDVWCGPGITDAASVDCLVSTTQKINKTTRERGSFAGRRNVHHEDLPFFDTNSGIPHHRLDVFGARHHPHARHRPPQGLSEIVMLQTDLLMGGRLDRYRDWRLDVDCMSYEELLELGDKIGYVSTGLKEDEISRCIRKTKPHGVVSEDNSSSHVPTEMQWKCTICQEEHEEEDEIGKLDCGHFYHMYCIKKWLAQKKTCPICKVVVESQH